jgi:hypothetical protein
VLEWYSGAYTESRYRVLIVRCADGRVTRFNIHSVWAKEGQWVFDVVASISTARPPSSPRGGEPRHDWRGWPMPFVSLSRWPTRILIGRPYAAEAALIERELAALDPVVEHIGSTACRCARSRSSTSRSRA